MSLGGYAAVLEDHGGMSAPVAPCLDITEPISVVLTGYAAIQLQTFSVEFRVW